MTPKTNTSIVLEDCKKFMNENPEYKCFSFGELIEVIMMNDGFKEKHSILVDGKELKIEIDKGLNSPICLFSGYRGKKFLFGYYFNPEFFSGAPYIINLKSMELILVMDNIEAQIKKHDANGELKSILEFLSGYKQDLDLTQNIDQPNGFTSMVFKTEIEGTIKAYAKEVAHNAVGLFFEVNRDNKIVNAMIDNASGNFFFLRENLSKYMSY